MGDAVFQVVLQFGCHVGVLKTSHDGCGHLGIKNMSPCPVLLFFWPQLKHDMSRYVTLCHLLANLVRGLSPAPLTAILGVSGPFAYLIINCVGLLPPSRSCCAYMLTVMCHTTHYAAAFPCTLSLKSIVKALTQFISSFGSPHVIQSDKGSLLISLHMHNMHQHIMYRARVHWSDFNGL